MALGLGRMMGFRFPENFDRPYISRSITEFWRRWHISLSNWMRLYLYIPLGGNRGSTARTYVNLWIVFLISGAWHGASWNFIVWGGYYGLLLSLERALGETAVAATLARLPAIRQAMTLLAVMIGWVFFRAADLTQAMAVLRAMAGFGAIDLVHVAQPWGMVFGNRDLVMMAIGLLVACLPSAALTAPAPGWLRTGLAGQAPQAVVAVLASGLLSAGLMLVSVAALLSTSYSPFLYFRF